MAGTCVSAGADWLFCVEFPPRQIEAHGVRREGRVETGVGSAQTPLDQQQDSQVCGLLRKTQGEEDQEVAVESHFGAVWE